MKVEDSLPVSSEVMKELAGAMNSQLSGFSQPSAMGFSERAGVQQLVQHCGDTKGEEEGGKASSEEINRFLKRHKDLSTLRRRKRAEDKRRSSESRSIAKNKLLG